MTEKKVIFQFEGTWEESKPFYVEAITEGFTSFLIVDEAVAKSVRSLGKVEIISPFLGENSDTFLVEKEEAVKELPPGIKKGIRIQLESKEDEQKVVTFSTSGIDVVIIDARDWKIIPYENLIADLQKKDTFLVASVTGPSEAKLFFETLEVGVDGVLMRVNTSASSVEGFDFDTWKQFLKNTSAVDITLAEITRIEEIGSGDRVCVDTISMLKQGEGLLIGSQAGGFFLLHGEIADTEFVNSRPFRVNAGAVHSYLLNTNNKTTYLSELKSGTEVLLVDWKGNTRTTRVGRVKIETRPMLLVEARDGDEIISAIIQNAETICLVDEKGKQISISKLKVGDHVQAHLTGAKGRHFGKDIQEK
ncbi:MAG: 3-dehydroquinate synthase II, partial [Promethearchaeota archaeon]